MNTRVLAAQILRDVEVSDAYANLLVPSRLDGARVAPRDRGFVTELVYSTLRLQGRYDAILANCVSRPVTDLDPEVRALVRLGAHQLLGMRVAPHAAISETVDAARRLGSSRATGFINAALRRVSERSVDEWRAILAETLSADAFRAAWLSHPLWIVRALDQALAIDGRADDLERLLEVDNTAAPVTLAALPHLADRREFDLAPTPFSPVGMYVGSGDPRNVIEPGAVRVQDQGSQLAALVLTRAREVVDGERWLDACAGPGGKAAIMLAEGQGRVELTANEVAPHRASLVADALEGIEWPWQGEVTDARELMRAHPAHWNRILIDAPCTGLGALRRRPESRWRKRPADLPELTRLQAELIDAGLEALAPGGLLAYVTCSPHRAETSQQVTAAVKRNPGVRVLSASDVLRDIAPAIPLGQLGDCAQLWPHVHNTDGMFISLLAKGGARDR